MHECEDRSLKTTQSEREKNDWTKMAKFGYFGINVRCSSIHVGLVQKGEKKERMRRKKKE